MPSSQRAIKQVLKFVVPPRPGPIVELGAGEPGDSSGKGFPRPANPCLKLSTIPWLFLLIRVRASTTNIDVVQRCSPMTRASGGSGLLLVSRWYGAVEYQAQVRIEARYGYRQQYVFAASWVPEVEAELRDIYGTKIYRFVMNSPQE